MGRAARVTAIAAGGFLIGACTVDVERFQPGSGGSDATGGAAGATTSQGGAGGGTDEACAYAALVLESNPIAYWRFEETSDEDGAKDEAGATPGLYGPNLTLGNPSLVSSCAGSNSLGLDAAEAQVVMLDSVGPPPEFDFAPNDAFSVEAWVRIVPDSGGSNGSGPIVSRRSGETGWRLSFTGSRSFNFRRENSTMDRDFAAASGSDGIHHVVGTFDPVAQQICLYVDGVPLQCNASGVSLMDYPASQVAIGDGNFVGGVDEVAIYDTVLGADTINDHYLLGRADD